MLLIAEREENDQGGGYSPVPSTTFPFSQRHTPFYLALHKTSTHVQCPVTDLGLWPNGPFSLIPPFYSLQGIVWNCLTEISRALSIEQSLVAGLPNNYFLFIRRGVMSSDSPRLQFAQHATCCEPWVGAPVGAFPHQLQWGSFCSKYSRAEIPVWHFWFVLLIHWTAFWLLFSLDLQPVCQKKKIWLASFWLEFSLSYILLLQQVFLFLLYFNVLFYLNLGGGTA